MPRIAVVAIGLFVLLLFSGATGRVFIEYEWWKEMNQIDTWFAMAAYEYLPRIAAALLLFIGMWIAFELGKREPHSADGIIDIHQPRFNRARTGIFAAVSMVLGLSLLNPKTIVGYFAAQSAEGAWVDPVFGRSLAFYLFELPFYRQVLGAVLFIAIVVLVTYLIGSARVDVEALRRGEFQLNFTRAGKMILTVILLMYAARTFLSRYMLLSEEHGFLTGLDYVDETIRLPLILACVGGVLAAILLLWVDRWALALAAVFLPVVVREVVPPIVASIYVKPNEISLEQPYIERHIAATRTAYALDRRSTEMAFHAKEQGRVDTVKNKTMLENVRLWDWEAFKQTVTQVQPLRPYVYKDADVDRYRIDGVLRQVLISPREIELEQLGNALNQWINPHFIYTHGYGMVMAEASKITESGLPSLYIQNAPPEVKTASLKITRPEIYFGESTHEPVFVGTAQQEFDYPSGSDNIYTSYKGKGGIPVTAFLTRLAAAAAYGDRNILLTGYLTENSRMLIHRNVDERLETLAPFIDWDTDPYLVLTNEGRQVWIVDGYLVSDAHPYSHALRSRRLGEFNYIRNSVKATVDAYDGETHLYVTDDTETMVSAYRRLFPKLFKPFSAMPADLRSHTRYPEELFAAQAEIYRTYHMRDAENFYNKSDLWDLPRATSSQEGQLSSMAPTYVIGTLPGSTEPEFLLVIPFTPRGKDNLIGYMAARCDGDKLGELVFLQLPKQGIFLGPMQVEARMDQDQVISKDLTLWNQQGSSVLRGQTIVLPVDDTFLYIKPLYLQARNAKMPQLKKVLIASGNSLIYEDNYELGLTALAQGVEPVVAAPPGSVSPPGAKTELPPPPAADHREAIIQRINRMRKDLDALEQEIRNQPRKN